jgi:glyoxylase-like metal-dependent hydrolase (beta-lactamase superfamily II)
MTISRRQFIISSSGAFASLILPLNKLFAQSNEGTFNILRRNVGTFENKGGTIGWLATKDALVVVDTQFPESAELCWNGLQKKTDREIDILLNTHHHGDHTAGNFFFKDYTSRIVAHENVPKLQKKAAEQRGNLDTQVYANETFAKSWKESAGDETITATYFGPAHTSGDAIIHFEKADVVHMGDLIFNRIPPYIDRPAGASIKGWAEILEKIHGKFTNDTIFIFGHGNPEFGIKGSRKDLLTMRDFLNGLLEFTEKGIKEGKTNEEIAKVEKLPGFPEYYSEHRKDGISRCVSIAYDELTNTPR